jgi:hypothetical protein
MGPSSYPPVILRPVPWTLARGAHQPLSLSGLLGLAPRKASSGFRWLRSASSSRRRELDRDGIIRAEQV